MFDTITVDTAVPPSQDEATEGTMSSEALPLIFEPFEDVTSEAAAVTRVPGPSHAPSLLMLDWTSPWQTSGGELLEPIGSSGPSVSQLQGGAEDQSERGDVA